MEELAVGVGRAGQTDQLGRHPQYSQEVKLQDTVCMEGA